MRKLALLAAATASMLLLAGAPAHATDLPDVPLPLALPSALTGTAGVGYSYECETKSSIRPTEDHGIAARFCVVHQVDQVWGTLEFAAPEYPGTDVFFDLYTYRCRQSDDVCVVIASRSGRAVTNAAGYWSTTTEATTQTWAGRYYKTCASLSTVYWGFGEDCTLHLVP